MNCYNLMASSYHFGPPRCDELSRYNVAVAPFKKLKLTVYLIPDMIRFLGSFKSPLKTCSRFHENLLKFAFLIWKT